ncbi:hypothetical protein [Polyangium sp. 15x6]|uniref:hypothetical protein n=1 Tax=Polyangium sp. 15x6 TaxID=3042687 RepID=UPI00249A1DAC|nr:hypothetical protein [Polyangium sp. 15x6]MDI3286826.1 hypothetical protein [Polyangium sp. 15x6]
MRFFDAFETWGIQNDAQGAIQKTDDIIAATRVMPDENEFALRVEHACAFLRGLAVGSKLLKR